MDFWIWDENQEPVIATLMEWAVWFETADRHVARDADERTGWLISTVFLGLDHGFGMSTAPILYESMVFAPGCPLDLARRRYAYKDEALKGHQELVVLVQMEMAMRDTE